jgi:hypothetical protein
VHILLGELQPAAARRRDGADEHRPQSTAAVSILSLSDDRWRRTTGVPHDDGLFAGYHPVPGPRIAMVVVPPLLADLIRHGLSSRVIGATIAELPDVQTACTQLREAGADVVIVGPAAPVAGARLIRTVLPDAQVLTVSPDLSQLVDLDAAEPAAFTPDALADRLRR